MKLKPLRGKVLVKPHKKSRKTKAGLYLPGKEEYSNYKGIIVSLGEPPLTRKGVEKPREVKEGDMVFFNSYNMEKVKIDGEIHYLIDEEDIEAILGEN